MSLRLRLPLLCLVGAASSAHADFSHHGAAPAASPPCLSPSNPSATAVARFDPSGVATALFCVSALAAGAAYEVRVSVPSWSPAHVRIALAGDDARALADAAHAAVGEKITLASVAAGAGHRALAVRFERSGPAYPPAPSIAFDVRVDELVDVGFGRVPRAAIVGLRLPIAVAICVVVCALFFFK